MTRVGRIDISTSPPLYFTRCQKVRNFASFFDPTRIPSVFDLKWGKNQKFNIIIFTARMSWLSFATDPMQLSHAFITVSNTSFAAPIIRSISKKSSGCSHAIHTLHNAVNRVTESSYTANICFINLSAFDRVNHYGSFIKLMKRLISSQLLSTMVQNSWSCIEWKSVFSKF